MHFHARLNFSDSFVPGKTIFGFILCHLLEDDTFVLLLETVETFVELELFTEETDDAFVELLDAVDRVELLDEVVGTTLETTDDEDVETTLDEEELETTDDEDVVIGRELEDETTELLEAIELLVLETLIVVKGGRETALLKS